MGKGLIGNSVIFTMKEILKGKVSVDDIGKIYSDKYIPVDRISEYISENAYDFGWVASERAAAEILPKYGVKRLMDLENEGRHEQATQEILARAEELLPEIIERAKELLKILLDNNKIIQMKYRVPEGQSVKVKLSPFHINYFQNKELKRETHEGEDSGHVQINGVDCLETEFLEGLSYQGTRFIRDREVFQINGEFYLDNGFLAGISYDGGKLFNNELELIANQIRYGMPKFDMSKECEARIFFMEKIFPQHREAIARVGEALLRVRPMSEENVLNILIAVSKKKEHTVEEIREGIADLTPGEVEETLNITNDIGEPPKDPHTIGEPPKDPHTIE